MRRERNTGNGGRPSPEERYRDFARDNDRWDRKVKESIGKIDKASRREARGRSAIGR
jgi:hypothetical protein